MTGRRRRGGWIRRPVEDDPPPPPADPLQLQGGQPVRRTDLGREPLVAAELRSLETENGDPIVLYLPPLCPRCGSDRGKINAKRTRPIGIVRYHLCRGCDATFRSLEVGADGVPRTP